MIPGTALSSVDGFSAKTGWTWLDGYQLDAGGDAVERRSIFVQIDGLQQAQAALPAGVQLVADSVSAGQSRHTPRAGSLRQPRSQRAAPRP
jgi:hypothetical protein